MHTVKVTLSADQDICLLEREINIHDLEHIILDERGRIVDYTSIERVAKRRRTWTERGELLTELRDAPDYEW